MDECTQINIYPLIPGSTGGGGDCNSIRTRRELQAVQQAHYGPIECGGQPRQVYIFSEVSHLRSVSEAAEDHHRHVQYSVRFAVVFVIHRIARLVDRI